MNHRRPHFPFAFALTWCVLLAGCASNQTRPLETRDTGPNATPRSTAAPSSAASPTRSETAAILAGQPVVWSDLRPMLAEGFGATALSEITLDRELRNRLRQRDLTVTDADLEAERATLAQALADSGAGGLTEQVRARRGLGPVRYAALLERNAMLRALVRERVSVTENDLELAHRVRYGPKLVCHLVVYPSVSDAATARTRLANAGRDSFIAEAVERSIDVTRTRGGRLDPFHRDDPAVPEAIRRAADELSPGEVSNVIALPTGAAVVRLDSRLPASGPSLAQASDDLRRQVLANKQREAMDTLARSILEGASITPLDRSLGWSLDAARTP